MKTNSLRFQLAMYNAVAVAVTGLAILLVLRTSILSSLLHEVDTVLSEDAQEIELMLRSEEPRSDLLHQELTRKAEAHTVQSWFVSLANERQEEIWSSAGKPAELTNNLKNQPYFPISVGGFRMNRSVAKSPTGAKVQVTVGSSLTTVESDLVRTDRSALLAVVMILLVSPMVGFALANRAVGPLHNIITTASTLQPERLDQRLTIRGTGDELDLLSHTINDLLDRIATHLERHGQFVANVAHELRSPLAALKSAAEVSLTMNRTPEQYENLLQDVIEEADSLTSLVNQLLLLAESERDRLKIHGPACAFDEVVRRSLDVYGPVAESKEIEIYVRRVEPLQVSADPRRLKQVVYNLIDNAIKYTHETGRVEVELKKHPTKSAAVLQVTDHGEGISEEDLPRVFDRFYRADRARSRSENIPGSGLGLSICHAIVTAIGGTISIQSRLGSGTTVTVELPTSEVPNLPAELAGQAVS